MPGEWCDLQDHVQGMWRDLCGGNITECLYPWPCTYESVTGSLPPPTDGEKEKPKPTLRHHVDKVHRNDEERPRFKMEALKVFGGDALLRQVSEAVQIREESGQMNRQQEWRMVQLPRLGLLE